MRQKVLLRWQACNLFGWGLLGLNLFEQWAADEDIEPLMGVRIEPRDHQCVDPLRISVMQSATARSNDFVDALKAGKVDLRQSGAVVVDAFGNKLAPAADRIGSEGVRNVARCIFEDTRLERTHVVERYDSLLCASDWNASLLSAACARPVTMISEGIDHSLFFPGPRSGLLDPGRFYIFTGGKIEFRKAQDLVIFAFREFASRHSDAVLVAAWNSPWPQMSVGFQGNLVASLQLDAKGILDIPRWITENRIPPDQFINLPMTPNPLMPMVLREMDCALQVSRCEACTNLPAKEAMACGIPVILANNTGTRDLIDADNCIALNSQDPVPPQPGVGTDGWGESRVEEIVEALETLYADTQLRKRVAKRGAEWILERKRTWRDHADALKTHLLSLA